MQTQHLEDLCQVESAAIKAFRAAATRTLPIATIQAAVEDGENVVAEQLVSSLNFLQREDDMVKLTVPQAADPEQNDSDFAPCFAVLTVEHGGKPDDVKGALKWDLGRPFPNKAHLHVMSSGETDKVLTTRYRSESHTAALSLKAFFEHSEKWKELAKVETDAYLYVSAREFKAPAPVKEAP